MGGPAFAPVAAAVVKRKEIGRVVGRAANDPAKLVANPITGATSSSKLGVGGFGVPQLTKTGLKETGKGIQAIGSEVSPKPPAQGQVATPSRTSLEESERLRRVAEIRAGEKKKGRTGRGQTILTRGDNLPSILGGS